MEVIELSRYRSYSTNPVKPEIPRVKAKAAVKSSNFRYCFFCFLLIMNIILMSMIMIDYYGKAFQSEYSSQQVELSGVIN